MKSLFLTAKFAAPLFCGLLPCASYGGKPLPPAVEEAKKSLVEIIGEDSSGSGFLAEDTKGGAVVVTNFHVFSGALGGGSASPAGGKKPFRIQTQSGREIPFAGVRQLAAFPEDLAVLEVEWPGGSPLLFGPPPNDEVFAIGFQKGQTLKIRGRGLAHAAGGWLAFKPDSTKDFRGLSGSPLLNSQGQVFGVMARGPPLLAGGLFIGDIVIGGLSSSVLTDLLKRKSLPIEDAGSLINREINNLRELAKKGKNFEDSEKSGLRYLLDSSAAAAAFFSANRLLGAKDQSADSLFYAEAQHFLSSELENRGEGEEARRWLFSAALNGHGAAVSQIADLALSEIAAAEERLRAAEEKKLAQSLKKARAGRAESQYYAGMVFLNGLKNLDMADRQDGKKAEKWLRAAAKQGHREAQAALGALAAEKGDSAEGLKLLREAAEAGSAGAQFNIGAMLVEIGGEANVKEGLKWLEEAANQGKAVVSADREYGLLDSENYEIKDKLMRLARPWHIEASLKLGLLLSEARGGLLPDYKKALKWLEKAARLEDLPQNRIKEQYRGDFVRWAGGSLNGLSAAEIDELKEGYKPRLESTLGNITGYNMQAYMDEARYRLGAMLLEGLGGEAGAESGRKRLEEIVGESGAEEAISRLQKEIGQGKSSEEDPLGRLQTNYPRDQYIAGLAFFEGLGGEPDTEEARKWLRKSAEQGYIPAKAALRLFFDERGFGFAGSGLKGLDKKRNKKGCGPHLF